MTDDIHPAIRAAFAPIRERFEEACRQARQEWPWVDAYPPGSLGHSVSMVTGMTRDELEALGGFPADR